LLLLGYLPDVIHSHFGDGSEFGVDIEYSITDVEDETGRRLKKASDKLDDTFSSCIATIIGQSILIPCGHHLKNNPVTSSLRFTEIAMNIPVTTLK